MLHVPYQSYHAVVNFFECAAKDPNVTHIKVIQYRVGKRSKILYALIDQEIAAAKAGKPAQILIKTNSLEDRDIIQKLYEASKAGVKVQLIVRGICCLVPGVKGVSDNIEVVSIVDRYLEHARVFIFHNGGDEKIYLSSADLMQRNLSFRIETAFPVYDRDLKKEIRALINLQLEDNVKARTIDRNDRNEYRRSESDIPVRAQLETYFYFKRKADKKGE